MFDVIPVEAVQSAMENDGTVQKEHLPEGYYFLHISPSYIEHQQRVWNETLEKLNLTKFVRMAEAERAD